MLSRTSLKKAKACAFQGCQRFLRTSAGGADSFRYCTLASRNMATSAHYGAHSSESYEQAYFYEAGAYQKYLVDLVAKRLNLRSSQDTASLEETRHILDIGGGTGNFAQALLSSEADKSTTSNLNRITVVDPFLDPTATSDSSASQVDFVKAAAEEFLHPVDTENPSFRGNFHQVLLKEVVHHLEDRVGIFRGMHQDVKTLPSSSSPSVLIITRPQTEIDYPLWDAARQVWKKNQPSASELSNELKMAGFVDIQDTLEAYPCQISLKRWQGMVQNRFWSTLSNFTDDELEKACQEMEVEYKERIDSDGVIHFEDRLVFVSARKG